jgi:hypothetical protein
MIFIFGFLLCVYKNAVLQVSYGSPFFFLLWRMRRVIEDNIVCSGRSPIHTHTHTHKHTHTEKSRSLLFLVLVPSKKFIPVLCFISKANCSFGWIWLNPHCLYMCNCRIVCSEGVTYVFMMSQVVMCCGCPKTHKVERQLS